MPDGTRGRMGRVQRLPQPIKDRLDELLRAGVPQRDILRRLEPLLAAAGERPLSAAGLNRYATRVERAGRRIREAREVADAWTAKFGAQPAGEVGQHVVELLRVLAFEAALHHGDGDGGPVDAEQLNALALAVQRLERTAEIGARRLRAIRREAADAAGREARRQGLSADAAAAIRAAVEGAE